MSALFHLLGAAAREGPGALPCAHAGEWTVHRGYAPGDDPRRVDWRLAARTDELLTRVDRPPRAGRLDVLLDESNSMGLGRPAKREAARRVAAALACAGAAALEGVRVTAFAGEVLDASPEIRSRAELGKIARFFATGENRWAQRGAKTDLKRVAEGFVRLRQCPGAAVWISDLFDPEGLAPALDLLRDHGYRQRVVHLVDRADEVVPHLGDLRWRDAETGAGRAVVVTRRLRRAYANAFEEFVRSIRERLARRGIPYARVYASDERPHPPVGAQPVYPRLG